MATIDEDTARAIESLVTEWIHEEDVPGASVVLVDADGELYAEGFGARDLAENEPATPDTLYGMGSISKPVTATAVAQLAEAGHLSLDDPVDEYVDHFEEAPGDPITIRELLSHTSGMPASSPGVLEQWLAGAPAGVADEADRRRFVRSTTDRRVRDADRFMYYNTGYDVLGRVVEAVDGRSFATYVREAVFDPLGMDRATYERSAFEAEDDRMTGYKPGDEDGPPEPAEFPFEELIYPAGGMVASPRDLARFVRAGMTDGSLDGARLCSPKWLDRCQDPVAVRQRYLDGREEGYGLGWMRHPLAGDEAVGHGGSILVSTAYAGFLEDAGIGVVLACNTTADPHPIEIGLGCLALAVGGDPTDVPALALREKCRAVAGEYESFRGDPSATVEPDGGTLSVEIASALGERELTAVPENLAVDDHSFYTVTGAGARVPLEFDLPGDGADLFFQRHRFQRPAPDE